MRRVVVTGIGAITPLATNAIDTWEKMKSGECGIDKISAFDASKCKATLAAEVKVDLGEFLKPAEMRKMDRFTQFAVIAAREAIADSGLSANTCDLERCDVLVASGIGGMSTTVREVERGRERGFERISPFYIPMTIANIAAGQIAIEHGLKGDCSCIVTACASSTHALGESMRHIRHGYADMAVCGGAEATIIPLGMGGFVAMQALHFGDDKTRASIPFDAQRSGFVMGEGAAMLVLEEYEHALARGAKIYGEVAGFGATCDAYHITAPSVDGSGAVASMARALADAGVQAQDIGYINAHGTSTPANDKSETLAIKTLFGGESATAQLSALPPVSSTKSMTGHMLGAAGALEAIVCLMSIQDGFLPPTINYRESDPECDMDVIANRGRKREISVALSNSLGFGGHNASLVVRKV